MSRKSQVKAVIDAHIKRNGKQQITGEVLNGVLNTLLNAPVIDIIQDGQVLPKDADGNVIITGGQGDVTKEYVDEAVGAEKQRAETSEAGLSSAIEGVGQAVTAETLRAETAEETLSLAIQAEVQRAMAEEAAIRGIAESKLTRIDLACDGMEPLKITYRGSTQALTFEEIYALVTDKSKFVTLLDTYMFILLPALSIDGDSIEFAGVNVLTHQAEAQRVIINSADQVSAYAIELESYENKTQTLNVAASQQAVKYPSVAAVKASIDPIAAELSQLESDAITSRAAEGEGVPALPFLTDAPSDGKQYARKDGEWNEVQRDEWQELILNTADIPEDRILLDVGEGKILKEVDMCFAFSGEPLPTTTEFCVGCLTTMSGGFGNVVRVNLGSAYVSVVGSLHFAIEEPIIGIKQLLIKSGWAGTSNNVITASGKGSGWGVVQETNKIYNVSHVSNTYRYLQIYNYFNSLIFGWVKIKYKTAEA